MSVWSEWKCVLDALPARAELAPLAPMVGRCLSQGGLVVRMFSRFWMFAMFGMFEMLEMFWKLAPSSRQARAELALSSRRLFLLLVLRDSSRLDCHSFIQLQGGPPAYTQVPHPRPR